MSKIHLHDCFAMPLDSGSQRGSVRLGLSKIVPVVFLFWVATAVFSSAQTFTLLKSFTGTNGVQPDYMSLIQGSDGEFYGTTFEGGVNSFSGTVFKTSTTGVLTTIHTFLGSPSDGSLPNAGLLQTVNGVLYGTTFEGGTSSTCFQGCGTVFKITSAGLATLHNFDSSDGAGPRCRLVLGGDGNLYGTTYEGGANGYGTVFKITPAGTLTTLHHFANTDGAYPVAGLVLGADGNLYGTASAGGDTSLCNTHGCGTVFRITAGGTLTVLHNFDFTDGSVPYAALIQASDGNFYGVTAGGGDFSSGTVFRITPGGTLTPLHSFAGGPSDGYVPYGTLVQGTDGNFYGTTVGGGTGTGCLFRCGTIFKITAGGTVTILHSFTGSDGYNPLGGPVQGTDGNFYGAVSYGGSKADGTLYSLSEGLGPFVATLPTAGRIGAAVVILGNNLKGSTSVRFNGTAATFTVVSSTEIKTTVPAGAVTGTVTVTTPSGLLKSNTIFRVAQ